MVIVVRQHPSPDDHQIISCGVNKESIDKMGLESVETIQNHARNVRNILLSVPQIFSMLSDEPIDGIYLKNPLVWTLAVNLTQLIGRCTRGGQKTVIWFTDAAFMPKLSESTEKNSVLLAVRKLLGKVIEEDSSSGHLIQTLYGPVYYPLTKLTDFITGVKY
jgi:hypothetical protein